MAAGIGFELRRKFFHIILTSYPLLLLYLGISTELSIAFSLLYLLLWLLSEFLRTYFGISTPTAFLLKTMSRGRKDRQTGERDRIRIPHWILGLTLVMIFADRTALLAATATLAFGDAASGLVKSALGMSAKELGLLSGIMVSSLILYTITGNATLSLLAPAIGMLGELASDHINDNFSIPILAGISAAVIQVLMP